MKKLRTIEMDRLTVDEFKQADKLPLIVVLDDVRSMHNVVVFSVRVMLSASRQFIFVVSPVHHLWPRFIKQLLVPKIV